MIEQIKTAERLNFETDKNSNLLLSIGLDIVGMLTFIIPIFGEIGDLFWAPIAGYMMTRIYKGASGKAAGVFAFVEEIVPFTDFIPTFTLMWIYTYVIKVEKKER